MLHAVGGLLLTTATAGCTGGLIGDNASKQTATSKPTTQTATSKPTTQTATLKPTTQSPGVIRDLSFNRLTATVTLDSSSTVTHVNLIDSSGRLIRRRQVSGGQTTVDLPLLGRGEYRSDYLPLSEGTYSIVAAYDSTVVDQQPLDATISYAVTDIRPLSTEILNKNGNGEDNYRTTASTDLAVTIKNTGNVPLKLTQMDLTEGVPEPISQSGTHLNRVDEDIDVEWAHYVGVDSNATFETRDSPLSYPGTETWGTPPDVAEHWKTPSNQCQGKTKPATLVLDIQHLGQQRHTVPITYTGEPIKPSLTDTDWACKTVTVGNTTKK